MTRNDPPDKLEWSIRPCSGVDWAQWDWGIKSDTTNHQVYGQSKTGFDFSIT